MVVTYFRFHVAILNFHDAVI